MTHIIMNIFWAFLMMRYAFLERLMHVYVSMGIGNCNDFKIKHFESAMRKGDIERVLTLIKALLASIPYDSFPKDKLF